ncbi:hypothetical protein POM88_029080 [Heracleum sosnowskyi]|uniref:Uncharacterized protein n=1 Tax=Heracleum sosnowskyi TaxID=360622 RepID=A0AAD8MHF1_9APIA|nr:hypothetical protein POM88_029080 [Heracleum sosnowskyi]
MLFTLSASVSGLKPDCDGKGNCHATSGQVAVCFLALYMIALGTGGIKPCMRRRRSINSCNNKRIMKARSAFTGIMAGFTIAIMLIALFGTVLLWMYGSVWTTAFFALHGGMTFVFSHEQFDVIPPGGCFDEVSSHSSKNENVICGFGRLGTMFGCDKYNIKPDLASIAKGLSSAYMPIGVVLASREVSDVIYSQSNKLVKSLSPKLQDGIKVFSASPIIGEIRGTGFLVVTEFADNKSPNDPFPPEWGLGAYFVAQCEKLGMLVRVTGENLLMCPPLIITPDEIDELISKYGKALKATEERVKELKDQKKKLLIIVSKLLKEEETEAWGVEPYDIEDADTDCKRLVHRGIVRVANIKFPLPYRAKSFSLVIVSDAVDYLSSKYLNKTLPELARVSSDGLVIFTGDLGLSNGLSFDLILYLRRCAS